MFCEFCQLFKMHFKILLFFTVALMCMFNVRAMPRDNSVLKTDNILYQIQDTTEPKKESVISIPGRVLCQFDKGSEEPSEDVVCQEHCLPKGYSYGICVGGKCSCI